MDAVMRDLARAWRSLRSSRLFTSIGVATLALGIGANVAIFSILHSVVLRPLPYAEPDRLVAVWPAQNFNKAMVDEIRVAGTLESVAGVAMWSVPIMGDGPPEELTAAVVGVDYLDVLGVRPVLGRGFAAEEREPGRSGVVILSHGLWQRRFGGDPDILGRVLPIEGYDHTARRVIGVLGPSFRSPEREADVLLPLHQPPGRTVATDSSWYVNSVVARLAPGATLEQASAEVATLAARLKAEHPGLIPDEHVAAAGVVPLTDIVIGPARSTLWLLLGAVGLVLLIACANVSNMLLARNAGRAADVAVRKSLGASRRRLIQEGVVEALVMALLGTVAGLGLAVASLELIGPEVARRLPRAGEVRMDPLVLGFAAGAAVASALLFGLIPSLRHARLDPAEGLRRGRSRGGTAGMTMHRLNRGLVAAEVALAVVLVSGAALVVHSFWRLHSTDPGFDARGVLELTIAPPQTKLPTAEAPLYYEQVLTEVEAVPGVADAAAIHLLPLTLANWAFPYLAEDFEPRADQPLPAANFRVVTPGYFDLMRIPLLRGRALTAADRTGAEPVGLVNRAFAELRWPGKDPVGKTVSIFGTMEFTVVGVVENVKQHALDRATLPEMYRPLAQWPLNTMVVLARAERPDGAAELADAVREAVWRVDSNVPIREIRPLGEVLDDSVASARLIASLLAAFGLLALVLGAVGVYGVMAYIAGSRRREYGIRAALGAAPGAVQSAALRWGVAPIAAGLAAGVAVTLAGGRLLRGLLYEVEPHDPLTLAVVALLLLAVAALATWLPARQAGRVPPSEVLKGE